jgi:mutator protein MutT
MSQTTPKAGIDYIGVGVGALIFNDEGKLLLALRGPQAKNERGKWEIPGGAVQFGETIEQALKREILEEIGIEIRIKEMLQLCDHIIPDERQHWVSPTYICEVVSGTPSIQEPGKCEALEWFSLEEAEQLPLSVVTAEDIRVLRHRQIAHQPAPEDAKQ